ncbi:MAG: energy transducer TonB [Bacteroidia bacterium]|nr:energy transducer TonB [Bacteroidia bacterium]
MTKTFILLAIFLPTIILGQETKKVTEDHDNPKYKEVFYVLKFDKNTRHGSYQKLGYKDAVLINGYYKLGVKDSIWTEYRWGGKSKLSEGKYYQDKKINVWEFFDFKGDLEQKYNFSSNEIVFYKNEDKDKEYKVINGTDTIKTKLERPPLYIGGTSLIYQSVSKNINYPEQAKENGTSGKVFVAFTIDQNGKTSDHRVIKSAGFGFDEEAIRVVKLIPDNWVPALLNGKTVTTEFMLPISFQMN